MADTGHAQSVSAAGGAGSLHNNPNREPECVWLHFWSDCKSYSEMLILNFSAAINILPFVISIMKLQLFRFTVKAKSLMV